MNAGARWVQHRMGAVVRGRVAGPEARERRERIWGTPGERWFTHDDPIARVHGDASMLPGGLAALLLQTLHPSAMAGVAGHSGYQGDPWGRLQRTSDYIATTTFGTIDDATRTIARVRGIHARIQGTDEQGRPYAASDPNLLRWVHVAEIWSFLEAHQAYGRVPLTPAEADRYVQQTTVSATLLGCTDLPTTRAELDACLTGFRDELEVVPSAREVVRFVTASPPVSAPLRPGYSMLAAGGVAVLPGWSREMLGLELKGPTRRVAITLGRLGTHAMRWALSAAGPPPTPPAGPTANPVDAGGPATQPLTPGRDCDTSSRQDRA